MTRPSVDFRVTREQLNALRPVAARLELSLSAAARHAFALGLAQLAAQGESFAAPTSFWEPEVTPAPRDSA